MCGVVGFIGENSAKNRADFVSLMQQSEIRGKHATGVSFLDRGILTTLRASVPASAFDYSFLERLEYILAVGHTRYITSGGNSHQPIADEECALVLNGVISQAPVQEWSKLFPGFQPTTDNDAEILWSYLSAGTNAFDVKELRESSFAAVTLHRDGQMIALRNGKRPLYYCEGTWAKVWASTRQVITRSSFSRVNNPELIKPGWEFCWWLREGKLERSEVKLGEERDLQCTSNT
jgi:glutamine phosphoribosylpyrophosphate amidotransferase